eukprot:jgi/Chrzof1/4555/Cz14g18050.t1
MATGDMSNDHPVVLGSTLLSEEPDSTLCTLRHGFLPESVKSSGQALLLQSDAKVVLYPQLGPADGEGYFEGQLEVANNDSVVDCVAVFDGTSWTIELLSGTVRARSWQRGQPDEYAQSQDHFNSLLAPLEPSSHDQLAASNADDMPSAQHSNRHPGENKQQQQQQQQGLYASSPDADIRDDDLDQELNHYLFGGGQDADQQPEHMDTDAHDQAGPGSPATSQQQTSPIQQQQPAQQWQRQQQQQQLESDRGVAGQLLPPPKKVAADGLDEDGLAQADTEEDDDPWNDFAMGAAARSRPATATHHTPTPPSQAVAEGPSRGGIAPVAAAAATAANLVSGVVHHDDESDDYDDEDGARGAHCSDDESDGIGVEVF